MKSPRGRNGDNQMLSAFALSEMLIGCGGAGIDLTELCYWFVVQEDYSKNTVFFLAVEWMNLSFPEEVD
ncbi:hypothetical protein SCA6_010149 [Theobroma cacao]